MTSNLNQSQAIGWAVDCQVCGHTMTADVETVSRFVDRGWPACCGVTTSLRLLNQGGPSNSARNGSNDETAI